MEVLSNDALTTKGIKYKDVKGNCFNNTENNEMLLKTYIFKDTNSRADSIVLRIFVIKVGTKFSVVWVVFTRRSLLETIRTSPNTETYLASLAEVIQKSRRNAYKITLLVSSVKEIKFDLHAIYLWRFLDSRSCSFWIYYTLQNLSNKTYFSLHHLVISYYHTVHA